MILQLSGIRVDPSLEFTFSTRTSYLAPVTLNHFRLRFFLVSTDLTGSHHDDHGCLRTGYIEHTTKKRYLEPQHMHTHIHTHACSTENFDMTSSNSRTYGWCKNLPKWKWINISANIHAPRRRKKQQKQQTCICMCPHTPMAIHRAINRAINRCHTTAQACTPQQKEKMSHLVDWSSSGTVIVWCVFGENLVDKKRRREYIWSLPTY